MSPASSLPSLLGPGDPPAVEQINLEGGACILLICDHASRRIPRALGTLGVDEACLERHIAWDIGAAEVTRRLAQRLDAGALLAGYSRLLIDCNRQPGHPQSVPEVTDGVRIPGNVGLAEPLQEQRVETFFRPYHNAITATLAHLWRRGPAPALFSVHSFTPSLNGVARPWDVGVLWNRDPRLALPLLANLRSHGGLCVGDNEPYSGREIAYSLDRHAGAAGLANCAVEIRQDHLESAAGIERWSALLAEALRPILSLEGLHQVVHY